MDSTRPSDSTRPLIDVLAALSRGPTRYDREEELARGGMGTIHRAWDRDLRRHLAMKLYRGEGAVPDDASRESAVDPRLARFIEEAQITGQLDHPGIVPVHELGLDEEGRLFFTMRLVRGKTLGEGLAAVRDGDPEWTEMRVLRALVRVCEAVAFAHSRGVVHRDLKPANVMVGPFGEVYVMDWGLAKVLGGDEPASERAGEAATPSERVRSDRVEQGAATPDDNLLTMAGNVLGTPSYMPPEQARGRVAELGPRSDVYAIGAILYEFLTGRAPYASPTEPRSAHEVLGDVLAGAPPPVHELAPEAPGELVAICEKAMARDASDRYADPMELAGALSGFFERPVTRARGALRHSRLIGGLQWIFGAMFWTMLAGLLLLAAFLGVSQTFEGTNANTNLAVSFRPEDPGFAFTSAASWIDAVTVGELSGDLTLESDSRLFMLAMSLLGFGALVFLLYVVQQTRHILRALRRGEPFARSNIARMRRIGGAMVLLGVLKTAQGPATTLFVHRFISAERLTWSNGAQLAYTEILFGALVFILAEVFRVGAELEERRAPATD